MRKSSVPLKYVLVIPYVLLVLIAGLIAGIITWYYSSSISTELGNHIGEQTSLRIEEQLDGYLNQANIANNYIKNSHYSHLLDVSNQQQTLDFMTSIIQANPNFSTLQVGYPDNEYIGIGNGSSGTILKKFSGKETNYDFYVQSSSTEKITTTKENFDVTKRSWYQEAITINKKNKPVWSSIYIMSSSGKPGVTLSEALYNDTNELVGVVGTDVVFNDLDQELYNIKVTENSFLFIVDEGKDSTRTQDKIIAQSTLKYDNKDLLNKNDDLLKQASDFIHQNNNGKHTPFYNHQSVLNHQGKNKDYFISYIPYKHDEGLNWYIGIVIPESDYLGGIYSIKNQTIGMWLVTFLLALLLGFLITHYINKNIKNLQRKLNKVENTGAMYEHESYPIKEINGLSNTFSLMSRRLYESYIDLQRDRNALKKLSDEDASTSEKESSKSKHKNTTDNL